MKRQATLIAIQMQIEGESMSSLNSSFVPYFNTLIRILIQCNCFSTAHSTHLNTG